MARRTKEDALLTRHALLDAAERVFQAQGVAGTSLNDIAEAAGTTRGAIYHHFRDKADLFTAMMDRVTLPLQEALAHMGGCTEGDPLPALRAAIRLAFQKTQREPGMRRAFEIATHKVEYVDSLCAVRQRHLDVREAWIEGFRSALIRSASARAVKLPLTAVAAAQGLQALADGLINNWLLDPEAFDLETVGAKAVDAYLRGLGLT